jgi:LysM repeat protein
MADPVDAKVEKAYIFRVNDPSKYVTCQFNPKDFSISKKIKWEPQTVKGKSSAEMEFAGGEPQDLTVKLLFDTTHNGKDVRKSYNALLEMADIDETKKNQQTRKSEPPECKFQWGTFLSFTGVIISIAENFVLFNVDGTPLRAWVTVTFSETAAKKKGQNPTTRSEPRKIWVVHEGETLSWIAYQEYGDAKQWRHIAEVNGLDNPMELHSGQVLKLTPLG